VLNLTFISFMIKKNLNTTQLWIEITLMHQMNMKVEWHSVSEFLPLRYAKLHKYETLFHKISYL